MASLDGELTLFTGKKSTGNLKGSKFQWQFCSCWNTHALNILYIYNIFGSIQTSTCVCSLSEPPKEFCFHINVHVLLSKLKLHLPNWMYDHCMQKLTPMQTLYVMYKRISMAFHLRGRYHWSSCSDKELKLALRQSRELLTVCWFFNMQMSGSVFFSQSPRIIPETIVYTPSKGKTGINSIRTDFHAQWWIYSKLQLDI